MRDENSCFPFKISGYGLIYSNLKMEYGLSDRSESEVLTSFPRLNFEYKLYESPIQHHRNLTLRKMNPDFRSENLLQRKKRRRKISPKIESETTKNKFPEVVSEISERLFDFRIRKLNAEEINP